jgi:hypothetical protein
MFVLLELCAKHVTCLWTQFFVGQIWGQSYQQKLVACNPTLRLKCMRLVKRGNWNVWDFSKERNWNFWNLSKERIEMCESCLKRELKCVRVLKREMDGVHVTRNASNKMRPCLKKELPMKNSKNSTSTHVAWVISSKSHTYVFGLFVEFTIIFKKNS